MIKKFFDAQIKEIKDDPALRIYGVFVAFGQFLTFLFWRNTTIPNFLSDTSEAICWPFFENCFQFRIFNYTEVNMILYFFGLLSLVSMVLFIPRRYCAWAYWWLMGVNILKMLILFQDFRLRLNQHYMLFFISFVFLCLPNKRSLLRYTLVCFYFWAGTLKFNHEWLSGAALYADPLWVPRTWIPASCVYAVILECVIAFGVLFQNKWIYWSTMIQLFLFHVVSWGVVKFFYPLLMMGLLMIFPLTYFMKYPDEPESLIKSFVFGKQSRITYLFILSFSLLQLIPKIMPGDEEVTGEGRLFGLHMFDAQMVCEGAITLHFKDGTTDSVPIPKKGFFPRIKCDPATNFSRAKYYCYRNRGNPDFSGLDLYYQARRYHETEMRPLVDVPDFCNQDIHYDMLRPNDWIRKW